MRLSLEVLSLAEQRSNPLGEREIILRGLSIPEIEHLGSTRNAFDAIDLSDNRIVRLGNFPHLSRLSSVVLSSNDVDSVDGKNLARNLPNLTSLVLSDNRIGGLHEIGKIGRGCPKLEFLILRGNPVVRRQHYRLYTIHKIPTLKVLDFIKVKQAERDKAKRLALSAAGAALEGDIKHEAREAAAAAAAAGSTMTTTRTFVPGRGGSAEETFATSFTPEQRSEIRRLVAEASSPAEIERIEDSVRRGVFPGGKV